MSNRLKKLSAGLIAVSFLFASIGCEDQGGGSKPKSSGESAKKDETGKKMKEGDKPRLEEQYGFTSQQVGP